MVGLRTEWAVVVTIVTSILFQCVSAVTSHPVGGASGWDLTSNLQDWAAQTTFQVGDFLVFRYTPVHNVLEVHRLDYLLCRPVHPISAHRAGGAVIQLTQPGPRYFVCGRQDYCKMGLRLQVQVLPQASNTTTTVAITMSPPD